ncbi:MAG: segregation/condensation protein A [Planctomycetota bacterium]|nr:segregation/condensation protein A [Planctomycetota bacterium]
MSETGYTVRLDRVFQGPMDLLLHLVREQEVEIHEVEISRVLKGYLEYLHAMKELDIEVAGEFLVMAATLMAIKSRSLLPRENVDLEEGLDPKDELIQRLIEYRRFREASEDLGTRFAVRSLQHPRGASPVPEPEGGREFELGEVTTWDLLAQFSRLMRETLANRPHQVTRDRRPLRHFVEEMARILTERRGSSLRDLVFAVDAEPTRESLIGSFCALLELARLGLVRLTQEAPTSEIAIDLRDDLPAPVSDILRDTVFDDEGQAASQETPAQQVPANATDASAQG